MNKEKKRVCRTIIRECNISGFVIELRSGLFLQENYENLVSAITEYKSMNYGEEKIELEIAASLHTLVQSIESAMDYTSDQKKRKLLEDAWIYTDNLLQEIFWPDFLRDLETIQKKWDIHINNK